MNLKVDSRKFRTWMMKNHWEHVKTSGKNHEQWEYKLENDGKYLVDSGSVTINFHVKKSMRSYSVKNVYEYMGLSREDFKNSFFNNKKFKPEELINKFKLANEKHKKNYE